MKNVGRLDQFIRIAIGTMLIVMSFFWLAQPWMIASYIAGAIMLVTAVFSFCPLYRLVHCKTNAASSVSTKAWLVLALIVFSAAYASAWFTKKIFLEDFNQMNNHYKQTLFLTGKGERSSAIANYEKWVPAYSEFQLKYANYRPFALKTDKQFDSDLKTVSTILRDVEVLVRTGDLHQAHLDLEKVRPVFQEFFKRNGFSMLSIALIDFHDAMELILEAAEHKDASKTTTLYEEVSDKLKAVEEVANDPEIKAIRANLDSLQQSALRDEKEALPTKAATLKSSFVKVYLTRG